MSKVAGLFGVKLLITLTATALSIGLLDRNSTGWVIGIALVATILNLLIGDLLVLLTLGNITASVIDGILAVLAAYTLDSMSQGLRISFRGLLFLTLLIAVGEYFFHLYLLHSQKNRAIKIKTCFR